MKPLEQIKITRESRRLLITVDTILNREKTQSDTNLIEILARYFIDNWPYYGDKMQETLIERENEYWKNRYNEEHGE